MNSAPDRELVGACVCQRCELEGSVQTGGTLS